MVVPRSPNWAINPVHTCHDTTLVDTCKAADKRENGTSEIACEADVEVPLSLFKVCGKPSMVPSMVMV